jgi:predicted double-glycine peptidase
MTAMIVMYKYATSVGTFVIKAIDSRWHVLFEDEDLGKYAQPRQALDDLVGGHTFSASCGDTSKLGLPEELSAWTPVCA